jgi:hypothetical protein
MAIVLTEAEERQILKMRETAAQHEWLVQGVFLAAKHLEALGRESCGGDGEAKNPATGERWGEDYFSKATALRRYGASLSANPPKVTLPVLSIQSLATPASKDSPHG